MKEPNAATSSEVAAPDTEVSHKQAVIYARVSTDQQVNRDRSGSEGFSIPAQRDYCRRKASELGAQVVGEYVDKGQSARRADRPQLQALLERLRQSDIDYVIVHKVDRLARNRMDDAIIHFDIMKAGARLISVAESIDETPPGMLLHGIMAVIAEYGSNNHSTEVRKGLDRKARSGGTFGRAPIGYVNKREITGRKDIRWVEVDPDRADHIRWAFEAYATGEWGLRGLTDELAARGLVTIETARCPARALHRSNVASMLHNPYYVGIVTYKGAQYPGAHEPLVDVETFMKVQDILSAHRLGEKQRRHMHYLRSTIFCARCGSRMAFTRAKGRGGEYDYFFCLGRHERRTGCSLPFVPAHEVETSVEQYYKDHITISTEDAAQLRERLWAVLQSANDAAARELKTQERRLKQLANRSRKLLDAYEAGAVSLELLKERQETIASEIANASHRVEAANISWDNVKANLYASYALAANIAETYAGAKPARRRGLNQAFFTRIDVDADDMNRVPHVSKAQLEAVFDRLLNPDLREDLGLGIENPGPFSSGRGLREIDLVELVGRYSNPGNLLKCLQLLQRLPRSRRSQVPPRTKQRQHRLSSADVDVQRYLSGVPINDLASQFGISRTTVMNHIGRTGAPRRRGVVADNLDEARSYYERGRSFTRIGRHFRVDPSTVSYAFDNAGIPTRPRAGRPNQ